MHDNLTTTALSSRLGPARVRHEIPAPPPATFTIEGAMEFSGLARSRLYELMGASVLDCRKAGRRTLIVGDSLRAYLANLPRADIRVGRKAA